MIDNHFLLIKKNQDNEHLPDKQVVDNYYVELFYKRMKQVL